MHGTLFTIGNITVHSYGLMIAVGIIVGVIVMAARAKDHGLSSDRVYTIAIILLIFGIIGSKLLYCLFHLPDLRADPHLLVSSEGFVIYGGLALGLIALAVYCWGSKIHFWDYFDLLAPSIALGYAFGKIGCLLAGCCYGRETDSWFHIVFPEDSLAPSGVPLWPTQPVSAAGSLVFAIILFRFARKPRPRGAVSLLYLLLYGVGRFVVEFFRADTQNSLGSVRVARIISLCLAIVSAAVLILIYRLDAKKKAAEAAAPPQPRGPEER